MRDVTRRLFVGLGLAGLVGAVSRLASAKGAPMDRVPKTHRVVFELSADGVPVFETLLNNVENLAKAFAPERTFIEVVSHGKGLDLLLTPDAPLAERMRRNADAGVVFAACANTMKRRGVTKEALVPFAVVVDSGVAEVVRKQEEGYAYLRTGL